MSVLVKQSAVIAFVGLVLLFFVVRLVHRRRLSFGFASGWVAVSIAVIASSFLTPLVNPIARQFSMTGTAVFLVVAVAFVVGVCIQLSISVSGLQERLRDLAEANALLRAELEQRERTRRRGALMKSTLVLIPAYNEQDSVADIVGRVHAAGLRCAVVVDGSPDNTARRARQAGAMVLELPVNLGIGGALRCGFRYAIEQGFHSVVQCDGDGQHPPEEIPRLVKEAERLGAHLLIASRWMEGSGDYELNRSRRFAMRGLSWIALKRGGVRVHDSTSGFRVISEPLLTQFAASYPAQFMESFEVLVAAGRAGYAVHEVPADFSQRVSGEPSTGSVRAIGQVMRVGVSAVIGLHPKFAPYSPADGGEGRRAT